MASNQKSSLKNQKSTMHYAALGSEIAGAVLIPALLGLWLDSHFGWTPVSVIVGAFVGMALAGVLMWNVVRSSNARDDQPGQTP